MKTRIFLLVLIIFTAVAACKKHGSPYTPECSGVTPKFSTDVSALIASSCAKSGCHAKGSHNGPGALTSYDQIKSATSTIRSSVVSGSMPDDGSLTIEQRNAIVCWIDAGANNN